MEALSQEEIERALKNLRGWKYENNRIYKVYTFASFKEAVGFIVRIAFEAERFNHHPEIQNLYNRVTLSLTTHDAGDRVTIKDIELARSIEDISRDK